MNNNQNILENNREQMIKETVNKAEKLRNSITQSILDYNKKSEVRTDEIDETLIDSFLRGKFLTKTEEDTAFNLIQSMSLTDLYSITNKVFSSKSLDNLQSKQEQTNSSTIQKRYNCKYIKFVDSLKICLHNIVLNEAGKRKINSQIKNKSAQQTHFIECQLPDVLLKKGDNSQKRFCARRFNNEITFKQIACYDIKSLETHDFDDLDIYFHIHYRVLRQKIEYLGTAKFNFSLFDLSKKLSSSREIGIRLKGTTSIILGYLKVTLSLGCGKLYFGNEFIDAVDSNKENSISLSNQECKTTVKPRKSPKRIQQVRDNEEQLLIGLVFISQAKYFAQNRTSYLTCRVFFHNDTSYSRVVPNSSKPLFNFYQQVPVIYDDELLEHLRDNFMVIEFYSRKDSVDSVIGTTQLPLHQFYIAYRNPKIVKYLTEKKHPVISSDWWEPIFSTSTEDLIGEVHILLALGTENQIANLEIERGFKDNIVKAHFLSPKLKKKFVKKLDVSTQFDAVMDGKQKDNSKKSLEIFLNEFTKRVDPNDGGKELMVRSTSDLLDVLEKALMVEKSFRVNISIISGKFSYNTRHKKKAKGSGVNLKNPLPTTYVSFEPICKTGMEFTRLISKSNEPQWNYQSDVDLPINLFTNPKKRLLFKVWKKTNNTNEPNVHIDQFLGFTTIKLTEFSNGITEIEDWFDIVNSAGHCLGQINIHIILRDNSVNNINSTTQIEPQSSQQKDEFEDTGELLNRALKRKFAELDEITQRLRLRLSKVTNDDSDSDDFIEQFEHDINTLSVEDDFEMVDFEKIPNRGNNRESSSNLISISEPQLKEHGIDNILGKLSLISGECSSRYVTGCSADAETILNELDHNSRPNIHTTLSFDHMLQERFGEDTSKFSEGKD